MMTQKLPANPMRITKIRIKNFRAFRGAELLIDLHSAGHNLLIYGENGSGKTSLFRALDLFFCDPEPSSFDVHRNVYTSSDEGYVILEIGDGNSAPLEYEWEQNIHPSSEPVIRNTAKTKGFLDYRSLLETHYVHRGEDQVNVFNLLVNNLLSDVLNPITKKTFAVEWREVETLIKERKTTSREEQLTQLVADFRAGLEAVLKEVQKQTNQLLSKFEQGVSVDLRLPDEGLMLRYGKNQKQVDNQVVSLSVDYFGRRIDGHHHFLNEARLSAIGISVYLAALLINPFSALRVLFLDDIFIGLDLSNRLPLLEILREYFDEWQVIVTTHDRLWFEMIGERVKGTKPPWRSGEFYCGKSIDSEIPVYASNRKEYLAIAEKHLDEGDLKAAAIYIRSAFESCLRRFCDQQGVAVRYFENPKRQKSDEFWKVIVKKEWSDEGRLVVGEELRKRIEVYRTWILNELSHPSSVALARKEVEEALRAVGELVEATDIDKPREVRRRVK